jgi:alpha-beta hydrolase superfamily lysophospholipase
MSLTRETGTVRTKDGLDLFWRSWRPPSPRAGLVVVHGLGEHSGRHEATAERLAGFGFAVWAADLRGHGRSPGGRVHADRFEDYFADVEAGLSLGAAGLPGAPLLLLGHSLGGLIVLSFLLARPGAAAGAVVSSPALGTHPRFEPNALTKAAARVLSKAWPGLLIPSRLDAARLSRDPAVVKAYVEDPLVSRKVSARWYTETVGAMAEANRRAGEWTKPLLLMQSGDDVLVDPEATRRWAAAAPPGLVEFAWWDGFYHEMFHEPEKDRVFERVQDWLSRFCERAAE